MYKWVQTSLLSLYRILAFGVMSFAISAIVIYVFLLFFYFSSTKWAAPITLSPSQERVLPFQPQLANLELTMSKQQGEHDAILNKITVSKEQLLKINSLIARANNASITEARQLSSTSKMIGSAASNKRVDNKFTLDIASNNIAMLQTNVDEEFAAKLITVDQAAERRLQIRNMLNATTDASAQALQLEIQSNQLKANASTLMGGASSLSSLASIQQLQQLQFAANNLELEIEANKVIVATLTSAIVNSKRVMDTIKTSPYYTASRKEVNVLFIPYDNLSNVKIGNSIYDCYLQVLICRNVGTVTHLYEAEEYARHPLFKTDLKGKFVGVNFIDNKSAQSNVVFINGKPLLF